MRLRTSKLFALEGAAEAFMGSLPAGSEPLIIPNVNAEDKARAYPNPRIESFKVAYWDIPQAFLKGTPT